MPTASPKIPPLPAPSVPVVDENTNQFTKIWYEYIRALDQIMRQVRSEIP